MLRFLALLVLPIAGGSAGAQSGRPSSTDIKQQRMTSARAECLIRRRPQFVWRWLNTLPGTAYETKLVRPMEPDFSACFAYFPTAYRSTYSYEGIRRGLIKEALRPSLAQLPAVMPPGMSRVVWFPPEQASDQAAAPAILANELGFCLARADWRSTRALVVADEGAAEARAAFRALVPLLAGCIPPGQRLTLDMPRLRDIMMETVFHATHSGSQVQRKP